MYLSNLQLIMMAEVNQKQSTGYDLTKTLLGKGWKASHQQIYRDLNKLEKNGVVSVKQVLQSGKPDKKLYLLTELGLQELDAALDVEPSITRIQDESLVHLFLGNSHYFEQLTTLIEAAIEQLNGQDEHEDPLVSLAVTRELEHLQAERKWVSKVIHQLAPKNSHQAA